MEYKQEQLMQQIKVVWGEYKETRKNFIDLYTNAVLMLNESYEEMGKRQVNIISSISKIQNIPSINIKYQKEIGILLPNIDFSLIQEEQLPPYSFDNTSVHLDQLIMILRDFFNILISIAEKEDILLKLSFNFKKINRRLNGLKNVITPALLSDIKAIKEILEELDRENFVRLKKTRDLIKR